VLVAGKAPRRDLQLGGRPGRRHAQQPLLPHRAPVVAVAPLAPGIEARARFDQAVLIDVAVLVMALDEPNLSDRSERPGTGGRGSGTIEVARDPECRVITQLVHVNDGCPCSVPSS
jgi:hypothetical protein